MSRDTGLESSEVQVFRASLSEQDFESVGGASGREGLRRVVPRREKWDRPGREGKGVRDEEGGRLWFDEGGNECKEGRAHGVGSGWAAMVSSMLASPPGGDGLMDVCFGRSEEWWLRTGSFGAVHVEDDIFAESEELEVGVCDLRRSSSAEVLRLLLPR
jgi:hypothetical protein